MSAEPEEIVQEVKLKLDELQTSCLEWKGRALAMAPALKVALVAIQRVEWVLGNGIYKCAWGCFGRTPRRTNEDQIEHAPGCERQITIKVLEEVIGK